MSCNDLAEARHSSFIMRMDACMNDSRHNSHADSYTLSRTFSLTLALSYTFMHACAHEHADPYDNGAVNSSPPTSIHTAARCSPSPAGSQSRRGSRRQRRQRPVVSIKVISVKCAGTGAGSSGRDSTCAVGLGVARFRKGYG